MRTIPDMAASDRGGAEGVATLLTRWQADRDVQDFTALVAVLRQPLERIAARTLRRCGIRDPGACDEVVALVLGHLLRLGAGGPRPPPAFERARVAAAAPVDPGWAYVRCIARSRARDVARAVRRRERLATGYATSAAIPRDAMVEEIDTDATDVERLHAAVAALDERSREVVSLLLDGKSQTVIAHVLGVCEGTVSRICTRAIASLRAALVHTKRGGGGLSQRPRCARRG